MAQLISTDEKVEKFILVAVQTDENPEAELSLKNLVHLLRQQVLLFWAELSRTGRIRIRKHI